MLDIWRGNFHRTGTQLEKSMLLKGGAIDGVQLHHLQVNKDDRGDFTEVFKTSWDSPLSPEQFSLVTSESNVMRGCHLHWHHDEYFCLLSGHAYVGLRDERPNSPTRNTWSLYSLREDDMTALIFPSGLVHGWFFPEKSVHLQGVSEVYDTYNAYDNHRVDWLDPDLEIPWPSTEAIMTDQAAAAPTLKEVRRTFPNAAS